MLEVTTFFFDGVNCITFTSTQVWRQDNVLIDTCTTSHDDLVPLFNQDKTVFLVRFCEEAVGKWLFLNWKFSDLKKLVKIYTFKQVFI